jgi:hypothetical protein
MNYPTSCTFELEGKFIEVRSSGRIMIFDSWADKDPVCIFSLNALRQLNDAAHGFKSYYMGHFFEEEETEEEEEK